MFSQNEKKEIYGANFFYRELGHHLLCRYHYRRSLAYLNKAAELNSKDKRTLLGRSAARSRTTYYTCALDDVKKILKQHPNDMTALEMEARYEYFRTNFEQAFLLNQKGSMIRQSPDYFCMGVLQCAEEVERTVGKCAPHVLRDHFDIIRLIAWKKALEARRGPVWEPTSKPRKKKPKKTDITPPVFTNFVQNNKQLTQTESEISIMESLSEKENTENAMQIPKMKTKYHPPQKRTTNIDNLMSEKYLEKMCSDKNFLKGLMKDPRIASPNKEGQKLIETLARKGYKNISYRQENLRTRLPFYTIKYSEIEPQGEFLKRLNAGQKNAQEIAKHDTEQLIKKILHAKEERSTNLCIKLVNKAKDFIDSKPLRILPNKEEYLKQMYDIMGRVYLDNYRLRENMLPGEIEKRVKFLFGLPISRVPSDDSVIRNNKKEFEHVKKQMEKIEHRISKASTPLETVWLFYELARYSIEMKKWDFSRFYARKSYYMARLLDDLVWQINVGMMLAKTHFLQQNKHDAKNELIRTFQLAKKMKSREIMKYIIKCVEVLEFVEFEHADATKIVKHREKEIVDSVLKTETQEEIRHLFLLMNAMPVHRRMNIMPGVYPKEGPRKKREASIKPSIRPKSGTDKEFMKQLEKRGIELLND